LCGVRPVGAILQQVILILWNSVVTLTFRLFFSLGPAEQPRQTYNCSLPLHHTESDAVC
jgi:hypothetical protein